MPIKQSWEGGLFPYKLICKGRRRFFSSRTQEAQLSFECTSSIFPKHTLIHIGKQMHILETLPITETLRFSMYALQKAEPTYTPHKYTQISTKLFPSMSDAEPFFIQSTGTEQFQMQGIQRNCITKLAPYIGTALTIDVLLYLTPANPCKQTFI